MPGHGLELVAFTDEMLGRRHLTLVPAPPGDDELDADESAGEDAETGTVTADLAARRSA